jgi:hypothetical protein
VLSAANQPICKKSRRFKISEPIRISVNEARQEVTSGQALLVCAYNDHEKLNKNQLDGALSFSELLAKLPSLHKSQEIIFYRA